MASTKLSDYEIERLENIRRNGEMMASLKIHSIATDLSQVTKRIRDEAKSSQKKKPRADATSNVIRRSLRTRGMPPDVKGLDDESPIQSPRYLGPLRKLGPLSMREAYRGEDSDRSLIERIVKFGKESVENGSSGRVRVCKDESLSGSVMKEEGNEVVGEELGEAEVCEADNLGFSVNKEEGNEVLGKQLGEAKGCKAENSGFSVKKEEGHEVVGEQLGEAMDCKAENSGFSVKKEEKEVKALELCSKRVCKSEDLSSSVKEEKIEVGDSLDIFSLSLSPKNIVKILSDRIMTLRFFPCESSRMMVAGNKLGHVGFWNLDHEIDEEEGNDGVCTYQYNTHSGPVSGISIQPHCLSKVFTSCYDGFIRLMDAEKEVFDLIVSSEEPIFSLAQRSTDVKCLYFGEGFGGLNIWDERSGKCSIQRSLHEGRINTIDFSSANPNLMATSSSDGTASIWDLRSIDAKKPKSLKRVDHSRSIHSAYFSPSGKQLATTSFDNTVGILGGANFEESSWIHHNNYTGRWMSPFKAIWGWTDSHVFIGSMKRGVDIISPALKKTIFTLQSPHITVHITAIPCRFDIHPYHVGMLAGAAGGGQVYVWTSS